MIEQYASDTCGIPLGVSEAQRPCNRTPSDAALLRVQAVAASHASREAMLVLAGTPVLGRRRLCSHVRSVVIELALSREQRGSVGWGYGLRIWDDPSSMSGQLAGSVCRDMSRDTVGGGGHLRWVSCLS